MFNNISKAIITDRIYGECILNSQKYKKALKLYIKNIIHLLFKNQAKRNFFIHLWKFHLDLKIKIKSIKKNLNWKQTD